jgi:cyclophilin family peptidyl-prolyl cis-trans isomerase
MLRKIKNHKQFPYLVILLGYFISLIIVGRVVYDYTKIQIIHTGRTAIIYTSKGTITISLSDKSPKASSNFVQLALSGFYNNTKFHRVVNNLLIQGGDPFSKDDTLKAQWGHGGAGYFFEDEFHKNDKMTKGTVAMVNNGPNTNSSQFFIVSANDASIFTGRNTIFGKVIDGMSTIDAISKVTTGVTNIPLEDVIVYWVVIK